MEKTVQYALAGKVHFEVILNFDIGFHHNPKLWPFNIKNTIRSSLSATASKLWFWRKSQKQFVR